MSTKNATANAGKTDSKNKAKKDKQLTELNTAKAVSDAAKDRVTKWVYPDELKSAQQKKEFRRKARAARAAFEKKINALKKSKEATATKELAQVEKEFSQWKKETVNPALN